MTYILIVFYATIMGARTDFASQQVMRSHAVVMQEFNDEKACRTAANRIMQAGATADCLPKGTK